MAHFIARVHQRIGADMDAVALYHRIRNSILADDGWARWKAKDPRARDRQLYRITLDGRGVFFVPVGMPNVVPITVLPPGVHILRPKGRTKRGCSPSWRTPG